MPSWWKGKAPPGESAEQTARRLSIQQKHRAADRKKRRAHGAVARAIRQGKLSRPSLCEECGSPNQLEAHHDDYAQPLQVIWLCKFCHAKRLPHYKSTWLKQ